MIYKDNALDLHQKCLHREGNAMSSKPSRSIKIFYSYASKDEYFQKELEKHSEILSSQGYIIGWSKSNVLPGQNLEMEIDKQLGDSDVILLLISANFFASQQCRKQMEEAIGMHEKSKILVIPIILRPVAWKMSSIGKLKPLPLNEKPITRWQNKDEAFREIVSEIGKIIDGLVNWIDIEIIELLKDFNKYYFQMELTEDTWVRTILSKTSHRDNYPSIIRKIEALTENASSMWWSDILTPPILLFMEQRISESYPRNVKRIFRLVFGYRGHDDLDDIGTYHMNLVSRHFQARMALKRVLKILRQDPDNREALYIQVVALVGLGKTKEALIVANKVQTLDPSFLDICDIKCVIFAHLGRIDEAIKTLDQAICFNPNNTEEYNKIKTVLENLRETARWLQLTLPPSKETLTLPQFAESLFLRQMVEEAIVNSYDNDISDKDTN
jgi:tetratricopeptide (TPR) repeat protein